MSDTDRQRQLRSHAMYEPGDVLAGYRIESELGSGGMGIVYEATQLSLDRRVALKVIAGNLARDGTFRERFRREGLAQAAVDHPHIVPVYEAGEAEGVLFLAMRFVRGGTLRDALTAGLEPQRTLRLLGPLADALDTAHEAGLIHRDIKPQNVLVSARDHAYLADFGLTKAVEDRTLTRSGAVLGTVDYVAPEHVHGEDMTAASDLYSFAAVLFECLAGQVPFAKPSEAAVLFAHVSEPPPALSEVRPGLPVALDPILARGLAKDPDDRPRDASELIKDVARALGSSAPEQAAAPRPETATPPPTPPPPPSTPPPRRPSSREATTTDRVPAGEPEPKAARGAHRGLPVPVWAVAAGVLVVAVVAGAVLGGGSGKGDEGRTLAGTNMQITVPSGWKTLRPQGGALVAGGRPQLAAGPGGDDGALAAAVVTDPGSDLLPDELARQIAGTPRPQAVRIQGVDAYRYAAMRSRSGRTVVAAVAVPVETGAVTATCAAPRIGGAFGADCERAFSTLRVRALRPRSFAAERPNVEQVGKIVERLNQDRDAALKALGAARTPGRQALAAAAGARAYDDAAKRLSRLRPGPIVAREIATLRASTRIARNAFRSLERAARRGDRASYGRAKKALATAEEDVQERIAGVRDAFAPAAGAAS
jgi:serine/threonine protein kinase